MCKWKHEDVRNEDIRNVAKYLLTVNEEFDKFGEECEEDINEIVPLDILKNDKAFCAYLLNSNNV